VVNLLLRFWDYEQGSILLGGHELRDYRQQDLSRLVSVVSQDTHLFNTTIRANLLLARPEASQQELEEAARNACIHDFILSLPQGYETRVGEQGLCMSGGERQRIALARAFLKDAPLLILDEATANLDAITEQDILRAIHALRQGRTTLMITHRLTGLAMVDEIIVLEQGRVKERGTHQDLLQADGLYWKYNDPKISDRMYGG
jgi:ABC-type multidrug transport system fused ATPase/permease subunit